MAAVVMPASSQLSAPGQEPRAFAVPRHAPQPAAAGGRAQAAAGADESAEFERLRRTHQASIRAMLTSQRGSRRNVIIPLRGITLYVNKYNRAMGIYSRTAAQSPPRSLLSCSKDSETQEALLLKCLREICAHLARTSASTERRLLTPAEFEELKALCQRIKADEGFDEVGPEADDVIEIEDSDDDDEGGAGAGAAAGGPDLADAPPSEPEATVARARSADNAAADAAAAGAVQVARTEVLPPGLNVSESGALASPQPTAQSAAERCRALAAHLERERAARQRRDEEVQRRYAERLAEMEAAAAAEQAAHARKRQKRQEERQKRMEADAAEREAEQATVAAAAARRAVDDIERQFLAGGAQ